MAGGVDRAEWRRGRIHLPGRGQLLMPRIALVARYARSQADFDIAIGFETAAVRQRQPRYHAQVLRHRPRFPGQRQHVAAAEQAALPGAPQLFRADLPRAQRRLDSLRADLQRVDLQMAWRLDDVVFAVVWR